MRLNIRLAQKSDISFLIKFNQAMAKETENKLLDHDIVKSGVEAVFEEKGKGFYVVAENHEGQVLGCLMITFEWSDWRNAWFWWIQSVYVLPEYRGKGIYRKLYEFVKQKATLEGNVCGFRLYVDKENKIAQKVYEKLGMKHSNYLMFEETL
ncbi:MAG: GNAT family N-acetyltransferase [Pyrinomonadaceae bacterium]|nr:GNAT family N-acetyltransferase [Pyrinomonadaceae bacterium]MCX7640201.1 GNAT family N-acetyltransferase [Pyrinomonadaceae bacterium]MDW8303211.1 GNAT family N-acetyltransferase [Acidobacteriota bacterium]